MKGGKNCTSWPKAIKGTLISLAIMLWGILNSVISACYIWRKVSGNCFVLLGKKKKKKKLLKWAHVALSTAWRFTSRPSACSPRVLLLLVPTPDSQKFSHKRWLVWRNKCHGDKKRLWHQPLDDLVATYKETVIICTNNRLVWVIGLWASSVAGCRAALCFYLIISLTALWLLFLREAILDYTESLLLVFVPSSVPAFSCPSIRPPIWPGWGETGRAERGIERGMERQLEPSQTRRDKLPL